MFFACPSGCEVGMMIEGVRAIFNLAQEIGLGSQIRILDIGGGLPVNYDTEDDDPTFFSYAAALKRAIPELWQREGTGLEIFSEFGRSLIQKAGFVATSVVSTKVSGGRHIAVVHVGSDLFLRTGYLPKKWRHRISVLSDDATPKSRDAGELVEQDIAGPLCFSGDLLAEGAQLPLISTGDWLVVHDAGGYTIGMYSRYNSRCCPAVFGFRVARQSEGSGRISKDEDSIAISIELFKRRETWKEVCEFWGT